MPDLLSLIISSQMVILSLSIAAVTLIIRKLVEFKVDKNSHFYSAVVLPILPILLGMILAPLTGLVPDLVVKHLGAVVVFGSIAGMLSGTVYRVVNAALKKLIPTQFNPGFVPDESKSDE